MRAQTYIYAYIQILFVHVAVDGRSFVIGTKVSKPRQRNKACCDLLLAVQWMQWIHIIDINRKYSSISFNILFAYGYCFAYLS